MGPWFAAAVDGSLSLDENGKDFGALLFQKTRDARKRARSA